MNVRGDYKMEVAMRKSLILLCVAAMFLVPEMSARLLAEENNSAGKVSIPWDEFQKLLELDRDEIILSWTEFQKLLEQAGQKYAPPYRLKDEKVVLTREQFKALLNQMKPPADSALVPPADYILAKAEYSGSVGKNSASIQADFIVDVFNRDPKKYTKIPLFPQNVALKEVLMDGTRTLVVLENNQYVLTTDQEGRHRITVRFSLKTAPDRGPQSLSFPVPRTPITHLDLSIPWTKAEFEITGAQEVIVTEKERTTRVSAQFSPTTTIELRWKRKLPEVEKGPAKVYADCINHIVIEDDAFRIHTDISLSVLQNTIPSLTLMVPRGYSILEVRGSGLGDWREVDKEGISFLEIPFEYPQKGNFTLTITSEKLLPETTMTADFSGFQVIDAIREKGFLGVELKSTSEITINTVEGLDKLDVSELPAPLIQRSQKPLLFGFKYLHHPYNVVFDITKHEEVSVISTVVDSANGVTLFTEDGKRVHRIVYKVRNTSKQFLELKLPKDAQIWSVFVGGEPARPRLNENRILIPLNRSRQGATGLAAFDVELIYFEKSKSFDGFGSRSSEFPVPDVIMSQVMWSVYLPVGYTYFNFGGSVEREKRTRGIRPLLGAKRKVEQILKDTSTDHQEPREEIRERQMREADEMKQQFSPNLALGKEALAQQVENEMLFSRRVQEVQKGEGTSVSGILPIRIQIPTTGEIYRFAKTIVSGEPLTMEFSYASERNLFFMRLLLILLVLVLLYALRRPIGFFLSGKRSWFFPIICLIAAIFLLGVSRPLSFLAFLLSLFTGVWALKTRFFSKSGENEDN